MKLNVTSIGEKVTTTENATTKMAFSEESQLLMFQLFSKNTYSNPIGSIVREITSNCFDSHREAGVQTDVVVRINEPSETQNTPGSISFIDYGVGLSPERIEKVYKNYFASTKRDSNNQIGGFGIGSKVPFSYTKVFYVTTIFDKIKYHYLMTMGEQGPDINLVGVEDTTEGNGTEVCVPFQNTYDKQKFLSEISNQLAYFDNITYVNCGVKNDYKIYQGKTFLYKPEGSPFQKMHVVLGKVAYPLDFRTLGLYENDYSGSIAVKFEIGEISVSMSRESLDYSPTNIDTIKARLKEVIAELASMRKKQYANITDFDFYLETRYNTGTIKIAENILIQLPSAACKDDFKVEFKTLDKLGILEIPDNVVFTKSINYVNRKGNKTRNYTNNFTNLLKQGYDVYIVDCEMNRNLSSYLKEQGDYYTITDKDLKSNQSTYDLVNQYLFRYRISTVTDWKAIFDGYSDFINNWLSSKAKKLSDVVIPNEWFEEKKRLRKLARGTKAEVVNVKLIFTNKHKELDVTSTDIINTGATFVYGFRDDKYELEKIEQFLDKNNINNPLPNANCNNKIQRISRMPVVQVRKTDEKVFKKYKKAVHVNDFIKLLGHKYNDLAKKSFLHDVLKANGLSGNTYSFNSYALGKEIFPTECETIKELKTLMDNGAKCYVYNELEYHFKATNEKFIKEVNAKIEKLVKVNDKFQKGTECFNSQFFNDESFVKEFSAIIKKRIK